jgi:putative tryptophan/tyrosine transport system substrate-binding protein
MNRRRFITLLGGAAAWPLAARAQQSDRIRRLGVLLVGAENDSRLETRFSWFTKGLGELGWTDGRNVRMDVRWAAGNPDRMRMFASELIDQQPDVIIVNSPVITREVQRQTQTIPIIFMGAGDPASLRLVGSLSRPEGNTTGVTDLFPSIGGKWLELLREAVPRLARVALIFNPDIASGSFFASIETAAPRLAVTVVRTPFRNPADLESGIEAFASEPNGGLIVLPPAPSTANRALINRLAVQHQLPTIYFDRDFASEGALMSYGSDIANLYRLGASYVDRILRGAKPGELPVQFPTKFELVVNLKTAKAIGLTIPEAFLLRADELIE